MPPELLQLLPQLIGMGMGGGQSGAGGGQQGLSMATGLLQQFQANKLKKEANSAMPGYVDPNQAGFLSELGQKRKSIDTGAAFAAGNAGIDASTAGTNEAIVRATGGDAGGTIQALLASQANAGNAKNNLAAQGAGQQLQYTGMYNALNNAIAARSEQLHLYRSQQSRAEWAQKQQMANQNMMAGLGMANSGHAMQQSAIPDLTGGMNNSPVNLNALKQQVGNLNRNPLETAIPDIARFNLQGIG